MSQGMVNTPSLILNVHTNFALVSSRIVVPTRRALCNLWTLRDGIQFAKTVAAVR
jgi:hypothetical protein